MQFLPNESNSAVLIASFGGICALAIVFWGGSVRAADQSIPWECTGFAGDAQDRCTRTFTELRQEKIAKLEKELEFQRQKNQQYQQQVVQQASAMARLEKKLTRKRARWYNSSSLHIFPPLGLGLRFGRDRFFGGSLFYGYPRYYSPRFYRHGYRRWHRN